MNIQNLEKLAAGLIGKAISEAGANVPAKIWKPGMTKSIPQGGKAMQMEAIKLPEKVSMALRADIEKRANQKLADLGISPMDRSGLTHDPINAMEDSVAKAKKNGVKSIQMSSTPQNMGAFQ